MTSQRWLGPPQECALDAHRDSPSDLTAFFHAAQHDGRLVQELMILSLPERLAQVVHTPRYHRLTLAQLFVIRAQIALFDQNADPTSDAELGAAIATGLPTDHKEHGCRTAALAYWLLGKGRLRAGRLRQAEDAFRSILVFVRERPSEEFGLACAGLAQAREDQGDLDGAGAFWLESAVLFSAIGSAWPTAACHAQRAFGSFESGDFPQAVLRLSAALCLLDAGDAPSLTARVHLALAEARAGLGDQEGAQIQLERARKLYGLPTTPSESIERRWREARIASASGQHAVAGTLLDQVRTNLLRHGSAEEAARCTADLLLLRRRANQPLALDELVAAVVGAFAMDGPSAAALRSLLHLAAEQPLPAYPVAASIRRRLRQIPLPDSRPHFLVQSRMLADRLLCRLPEHADPVGAASHL
jgi:hypothetical protein